MGDTRATRYVFALALVLLAFLLTLVLQQVEYGRPTLFLFFAAIVAASWFGGVGPGCVAAAASVPAGIYFYAASLDAVQVTFDNVVLFVFFAICAMAGGLLSSRQRDAEHRLQRAHRQLAIKADELSDAYDVLKTEVAERHRAESALADARGKLAHAARLTALGELTASIAHEINQPLTAVATNAACCVRWLEPDHFNAEEARDAAAGVVQDATRAGDVIKRIRAMVRREPPVRVAVDVNALIADALALIDGELKRNEIEVRTDFTPAPKAVMGDPVQLQQVVLNLALNAMDAMATRPAPRTLSLTTENAGDEVVLTVRDTGAGFGGRAPDSFFDAFVTSKTDGMGLGLSICRSIVEAHGGRISARSAEPQGAVLSIVLPAESQT